MPKRRRLPNICCAKPAQNCLFLSEKICKIYFFKRPTEKLEYLGAIGKLRFCMEELALIPWSKMKEIVGVTGRRQKVYIQPYILRLPDKIGKFLPWGTTFPYKGNGPFTQAGATRSCPLSCLYRQCYYYSI